MNPWALLGGVVAALIFAGGAYLQGRSDGGDKCLAQQARDERVQALASEAAASATATAIGKLEVKNVQVTQKLEREVIEKTVFRDCRSGPYAVGLFNSAIPGAPAASGVDPGELPASGAAR